MTLSRLSDRVGQVLSERYRLLAAIGSGASASVYLADDVTLRRRVAVKILHPALAGDEAFLRRFRAEAQAAAALNHPNVMAVYDWGHDEVPFLVTEYLGGGSLRTILDQGRLLAPAQTLVVGLEASRGLDYAHRQGFVHRDVKPANLLFDEEARLRIADFGLARALAEAAWTEPHGAVLGTARYASPEQARGEHLDGRSDVYSLALVMIEAVTGVVPFSGDTTIGTLMARVETPPEVPESLGALRAPLLAAGTVRPADRPDAGEFSRLLLLAAEHLDRPEPLALAGAMVHDHAVVADRDPTTIRHPEAEPDIMSAPPGTVIDGIRVIPDDPRAATAAGAAAATTIATPRAPAPAPPLARFVPEGDGDPPAPPRTKRSHKRLWIGLALVLALLAIGGGAYAYWYNSVRVATHPMPNLVGTNVSQLGHTIAGTDWKVHQGAPIAKDGTVPGQILLQKPLPGVQLAEGATIDLLVSSGPPPVPLPTDLAGKPLVAATAELQAEGLKLGAVSREFSETAARDVVLRVAPGVAPVLPKGSAVPLVVSAGPKPRTIPPGIVGGNVDAAKAQLSALGLVVVVNPQSDENIPAGTVMASNPASGASVPKGSTVTLTVSSGPPTVVIPADIVNKSVTDAAAELQSLGLTVSGINGSPLAHVKGTNPAVGTTVRKGTAVQLITG